MIKKLFSAVVASAFVLTASAEPEKVEEGFTSIFDGKSLDGWKIGGEPANIKVADGAIVANGNCTHAFYMGKDGKAKYKDFELRADIMTKPNSNGGFFIHTEFQDKGWPAKGYEVQVNNTQSDWRKSGGLYGVVDNKEPFEDNTWMKYVIRVEKGKITVSINGKDLVKDYVPEEGKSKLLPDGGTFAIQAHDPGSTTLYKNIRVKSLD
jgi:hypothetical protein